MKDVWIDSDVNKERAPPTSLKWGPKVPRYYFADLITSSIRSVTGAHMNKVTCYYKQLITLKVSISQTFNSWDLSPIISFIINC